MLDGELRKPHIVVVFEEFEVALGGTVLLESPCDAAVECRLEGLVVEGVNDFRPGETGVVEVFALEIEGSQGGEPTVAVDDVGHPAELADGFIDATNEEDGAFVIVGKSVARFVGECGFSVEEVFVIYEVDLHTGHLYGGYFDDKWVIGVVDDEIHARESDHFVELVPTFVDASVFGHKSSDLIASLLHSLR